MVKKEARLWWGGGGRKLQTNSQLFLVGLFMYLYWQNDSETILGVLHDRANE